MSGPPPALGSPSPGPTAGLESLADFVDRHRPLLCLTGAGVSTDSGIPDYRDSEGRWKGAEPIRFQSFLRDGSARRRYWARSFCGWPLVAAARPNPIHLGLADLESRGRIHQLVTQNVDGLHQGGGSRRVIDLHGRIDRVDCLGCGLGLPRGRMQEMLALLNPGHPGIEARAAPDGDAHLDPEAIDAFVVPPCPACGGLLKPAVVFFGENVPRSRVELAMTRLAESRGLLVLGSSLTVYSGYRFCLRAAELSLPIAILNRGRTRADALATLKLDADCAATLATL